LRITLQTSHTALAAAARSILKVGPAAHRIKAEDHASKMEELLGALGIEFPNLSFVLLPEARGLNPRHPQNPRLNRRPIDPASP
jgi:hypothetical protein